ncbi:primosomal protein N' [Pseudoalteromonas luteoviolacea]|uniref:Replication restart protein PriA n=1 Tax=Pseudoalteromonas luteoviolacea DSM 6061 TaxID=1365250 RepID=A0A161ZSQ6_9GAMM|nr:primosomal protein N' [Pseudoalteromonas luteoviolacea]KZN31496.1 DEAD/DEAH box helicase [Pseudoalteromonas luteoviolacea DSM 6061]MBE0388160.1 primosomal protein N' (replication factor Y) (superfamily II helicase) [Pseudoalteromonas luteoviolacea DSM 6061]
MPFAAVAIKVPLHRTFDYTYDTCQAPCVGGRVWVKFANRRCVAVVTELKEHSDVPKDKVKAIESVIDEMPVLSKSHLAFLRFASQYYCYPFGDTLFTALPGALRDGEDIDKTQTPILTLTESGRTTTQLRAKKQLALLEQLRSAGDATGTELKTLGFSQAQIKSLLEKQLIREELRQDTSWQSTPLQIGNKPTLNPEQATACSAINHNQGFRTFLIEGVTGSGKTEVYLQCLEKVLAAGKQALVLVPEIGLTPQTVNRFKRRFPGLPIDLWHSNLTDNERLHTWRRAQQATTALVIGTRSSIFLPFQSLAMIIVDEEHDHSFKQQDSLRYHARDLAAYRANQSQIPLLLGTATPALETLKKALDNKYQLITLSKRAQTSQDNSFHIIDMKAQQTQAGFASSSLQAIKRTLALGKQAMVFLNRRGFAPTLICHECSWISDCERCSTSATYHKNMQRLVCHHCGEQQFVPHQCPDCGSTQIMPTGLGTEQLEEFLTTEFPDIPVCRIDRDSTRRKGSLESALERIHQGGAQILIGTQMLAKGHHFPDVSLVIILDVDSGLYSCDFRATEHMAQLVTQVAGRAGRSGEPGTVLLQTHFPEHPLLQDLVNNGYQDFARYALTERQEVQLPPYAHLAIVRVEATSAHLVMTFLSDLVPAQPFSGIQLLGPIPAPMERLAGKYRYQLHIQATQRNTLHQYLMQLKDYIGSHKLATRVRWNIDVDPMDTF